MTDPWILGLSASHNGAACLLRGDTIVAAVQEERLSRLKRDRTWAGRPSLAVACVLEAGGIGPADLDLVVSCVQGRTDLPGQDVRRSPQLQLDQHGVPSVVISHHTGHAAHGLGSSGFDEAAILVIDGLGSLVPGGWESTSLFLGRGERLDVVEQQLVPDGQWLIPGQGMPRFRSLGGMYSAVAQHVFGDPMEAGKVMGLAPLGQRTWPADAFFTRTGGRLAFHDEVPAAAPPMHWTDSAAADLAASVQGALEEAVLGLARHAREVTGLDQLVYSGGVALNCVLNERLIREAGFAAVHVPPAAEDSGCAIGAAWFGGWHRGHRRPRRAATSDRVGPPHPSPTSPTVPGLQPVATDDVIGEVAGRLADGAIVGWWQGRSELGPRALGQRSILADPRRADMKQALNARIKRREGFRPFAPAVLAEAVDDWFVVPPQVDRASPFMLRVLEVRAAQRERIPAVVHVDGSARVQTVSDGPLRPLLERFEALSGVPILLNTSFNGPGEPLVETPEDALWCAVQHGLDLVVIGERVFVVDRALDVLDLPVQRRGIEQARDAAGASFRIGTPWGDRTQRVPATLLPLLDGPTGRALLGRLSIPGEHPADWLRQALIQLRNARVIAFESE